jgi:hypothetical protein
MKPIERIALYLKTRHITPHSFEKKIHLSNGYFSKQLRNLGSVGSDILIKIHENYGELNILWVLIGAGEMLLENYVHPETGEIISVENPTKMYKSEESKLKLLEDDIEKMNFMIKDKEKIISLYEFMLHNQHPNSTIQEALATGS